MVRLLSHQGTLIKACRWKIRRVGLAFLRGDLGNVTRVITWTTSSMALGSWNGIMALSTKENGPMTKFKGTVEKLLKMATSTRDNVKLDKNMDKVFRSFLMVKLWRFLMKMVKSKTKKQSAQKKQTKSLRTKDKSIMPTFSSSRSRLWIRCKKFSKRS